MMRIVRYRDPAAALAVLAVVAVVGAVATDGGGGMGDLADCERPRPGALAQPASALSALAFVVVGLGILGTRHRDRVAFGVAAILIGVGSFSFHRAATDWSGWLDTFGVAVFVLLVAARNLGRIDALFGVAVVLLGGTLWLTPNGVDNAVLAALVSGAIIGEVAAWRRRASRDRRLLGGAAALYGAGLVVFVLSRSDGPWCDPDAALQGHAAWHVMAAAVVALLFAYFASERAS